MKQNWWWFYWLIVLTSAAIFLYAVFFGRQVEAHEQNRPQPQIDFSTGPYGTSVAIATGRPPVYVPPQPQVLYPQIVYPQPYPPFPQPPHCGWIYREHPSCQVYYRRYYERQHYRDHGHGHGHGHDKHRH